MPALALLRDHAVSAARELRLGHTAEGNEELVALIDALAVKLAQQNAAHLLPILGPMLSAQARGDHLYLADLLEYELVPRLDTSLPGEVESLDANNSTGVRTGR